MLNRPHLNIEPEDAAYLMELFPRIALNVTDIGKPAGLPDPDDEVFLAIAMAAKAEFLVTGNLRHFPAVFSRGVASSPPPNFSSCCGPVNLLISSHGPSSSRNSSPPAGPVAKRLPGFELRPQQQEMAAAVEAAFAAGEHLIAEAGTGVGKSFAYLVPAIAQAAKGKKVVISTHTISLQEQLIEKDIPFLRAVSGLEFSAVLCKGRGNYVCMRRLEQASKKSQTMLPDARSVDDLIMIEGWATKTKDGSLSDLPRQPAWQVWDKVCAERGNCLGRRCRYYEGCFYQASRRRIANGQILVCNHAMFFSDLALKSMTTDPAESGKGRAGHSAGVRFCRAG